MKSLLGIQQDIRKIETSVQDITENIKSIDSDIEMLRNSVQDTDMDYLKIEILAKRFSFGKHPLYKLKDERACQIYLEMLLNIVKLDSETETTIKRMVFIQWLQIQSRIDWSLEELYKDCFKMKADFYYEFAEAIPEKYRESFMVDALIVANIGGTANQEIFEYLVDLSVVLAIDKERLRKLSLVAHTVLCQNLVGMKREDIDEVLLCAKSYEYYIGSEIIESGIVALRELVVEIKDSESENFKWKVKQMQKVEKGDIIATYTKKNGTSFFHYEEKEIKATLSGTVILFRDNCTNYAFIVHKTDNKDSVKAWVKGKKWRI